MDNGGIYGYLPEAERRIEDAVINSKTTLDLRGLFLTTLPATLSQLPLLQELDLSDNGLTRLPEPIKDLAMAPT